MAVILKTELSQSVILPDDGKISMFFDEDTKNLAVKTSVGNVKYLGGGQIIKSFTFNDTNNTTTYKNAGSVYLQSGTLSVSSSIQFGSLAGNSSATCQLYKEDSGQIAAVWTATTGQFVTENFLSTSYAINSDGWYTARFKINFGSDTAIIKGMRLVYD